MADEGHRYTVDEALTSAGFGKFQYLVFAYAGLAVFAEAMEIMILSFIGPAVKSEWGVSPSAESLLSTVVFAGNLVGVYLWGLLSDNYGRKKGFLGIAMITSGIGLLSAFSPNYISLVTLRGLVGIGIGSGPVFSAWFLEFVPAAKRGMWMVIFSTFWTLGSIFEAALAWIVMITMNWRWLLALSSIPSFAVLLLYSLAPESPRYLNVKGRTTEVRNILDKIALLNKAKLPNGMLVSDATSRPDEELAPPDNTPLLTSSRIRITKLKSGFSSFLLLFSPRLVRTTLLLWMLFFGNSFTYYGIILLTSKLSSTQSKCGTTLTVAQSMHDSSLYFSVFLASLGELPGLVLAGIIVDRAGRKLSLTIMLILVFICILPLAMLQSNILITGLLVGARMFAFGAFTIACIFTPEIYPTYMRTTGAGVANSIGKVGGMVCPLVAVGLVTGCLQTAVVILFGAVILFAVICVALIPFETRGQELSDYVDA